jgi:pyruvate,water dikinase
MGATLRASGSFPAVSSVEEIKAAILRHDETAKLYRRYLERFGDRCVGELKLESATIEDDPSPLLQATGAAAAQPLKTRFAPTGETSLFDTVRGGRLRRFFLRVAVAEAKQRVRDRENLRFERTRVFGRARRIFLEMGKRLTAERVLSAPNDVFYLTVEELLSLGEYSTSTSAFKAIVAARRAEFETYARESSLPRRFETIGAPGLSPLLPLSAGSAIAEGPDLRKGLGCSPGVVRGRARVVRDPSREKLEAGDILIAEFTDPGWITVFVNAAGLAVERGSLLSHSAIVARELQIPAVVGAANLLAWVQDGEQVEIDGAAGTIRKVTDEAQAQAEAAE